MIGWVKKNWELVIIGALLVIGMAIKDYLVSIQKAPNPRTNQAALLGEVKRYIDTDGKEVVKGYVYDATKSQMKDLKHSQDSLWVALADNLAKSGTVIQQSTYYIDSSYTETIFPEGDSLPTYKGKGGDEWVQWSVIATPELITPSFYFKDMTVITHDYERKGLFKQGAYQIEVKQMNPYTTTDAVRSYRIKERNKKLGFGVSVGYGMGVKDFQPQPFLGVSLNYNLIEL